MAEYYTLTGTANFADPVRIKGIDYIGAKVGVGSAVDKLPTGVGAVKVAAMVAEKIGAFALSEKGDHVAKYLYGDSVPAWVVKTAASMRDAEEVGQFIECIRTALGEVNKDCPTIASQMLADMTNIW